MMLDLKSPVGSCVSMEERRIEPTGIPTHRRPGLKGLLLGNVKSGADRLEPFHRRNDKSG